MSTFRLRKETARVRVTSRQPESIFEMYMININDNRKHHYTEKQAFRYRNQAKPLKRIMPFLLIFWTYLNVVLFSIYLAH